MKKLDKQISAAFRTHFNCVQIPLLHITQIYKEARERVLKGEDVNQVMHNMANRYKLENQKNA